MRRNLAACACGCGSPVLETQSPLAQYLPGHKDAYHKRCHEVGAKALASAPSKPRKRTARVEISGRAAEIILEYSSATGYKPSAWTLEVLREARKRMTRDP